ncbi:FAD-dependent oxidoreductase [Halovibrio salipaludis]|uniref:FAD-dependent oxidoreductase n=1 Tax=Halovibrio salipaludis TaxID=2032626 RepID=A0A2A2FAX0_9GAMM|nr:FAD-dependent oxidoreductase [Halovibrio salipaludis]PAU81693.1 FAD-dependent oxidoreductase [Halovibrio salipaludis]
MGGELVIIGHGMATQRLLELLAGERHGWRVTVVSDEQALAYNRILLSPWLAGETTTEALPLAAPGWYANQGVHLHQGDGAAWIDRAAQAVITRAGHRIPYDRLVIATGSRPAIPGIEGAGLEGVTGFRTLEDARWMAACARKGGSAVVLGGGFLGLEAAEGLRAQGMKVSVVHRGHWPLNRQLDETAGGMLAEALRRRGVALHLANGVDRIEGDGRVETVRLSDGRQLPADMVVIAAGTQPNRDVAAYAGLECGHGIHVDATLTTSDECIQALGECCQFRDHTYGLVEPVYRQAEVLADRLCGGHRVYREAPVATRLKISGVAVFSCGDIEPRDRETESILYHDRRGGEYRRLLLKNNRLVGAVLYGDASMGPWLFDHLSRGTDLSAWRASLAFGEAYCEAA